MEFELECPFTLPKMMLQLFIAVTRQVQKWFPWLHFTPLDKMVNKVWRFLVERKMR